MVCGDGRIHPDDLPAAARDACPPDSTGEAVCRMDPACPAAAYRDGGLWDNYLCNPA